MPADGEEHLVPRFEVDDFHNVHTSPPWVLRESKKHPGQFNLFNTRTTESIPEPSPYRSSCASPPSMGPASGQAMGSLGPVGSVAASSSSSTLRTEQVGPTGPMRPFGRPRATVVGAVATGNVSVHQITATGGDGNGRDEFDCLFDAVRSVASPSTLQGGTIIETYIRSLPWADYLRIEALIYVFRNSLAEAEETDILFAVWDECRRIVRTHQQNGIDNLVNARRVGTDR